MQHCAGEQFLPVIDEGPLDSFCEQLSPVTAVYIVLIKTKCRLCKWQFKSTHTDSSGILKFLQSLCLHYDVHILENTINSYTQSMYCDAQILTVKFRNCKLKHRVRESNVNSAAYINNQPTLSLLMTAPNWLTAKYQSPPKYSNN